MTNPVAYVIWYGNWTGDNGTTITENFLQGLGTSDWWDMTTEYNNTSPITFGSSITDSYSQGTSLTQSTVFSIVQRAIDSGALPNDQNGIYFVLTSGDCTEETFCVKACGWHSFDYDSGLIYSWVGNPEPSCPGCSNQPVSPNGNPGADAMITTIAHEATEATTDPYIDAWYDSACSENADKCVGMYGNISSLSNGAQYNMVVNGLKYLVEQNWRLSTGSCASSLTSP
ncbi:unnamed protein product [Rotaria sp. Silwood2]|nr:unnamed protein product [Rotaria sp. Silwood2]CAF3303884.1 unnamed protein product [Rotaria sp. Silwood2]CAF4243087.1 unnamed protein product [Rotaria sp. Silwood2]CAF4420640.1 unnamed protein product [Rotaria sp. Silwood2]